MKITKPKRNFVPEDFKISSWETLKPFFEDLLHRSIDTESHFQKFLADGSELEAILEEDLAWRYIRMTINTKDEALSEAYRYFVTEIQPQLAPYDDKLNKKIMSSPFTETLKKDPAYFILFRRIKSALDLYREANIPLLAEIAEESQKYGAMSAAQSIEHDGKKLTMQQAAMLLKEQDEALRRQVFEKMTLRRRADYSDFDTLFDGLRKKRHQLALNAGFSNFRDYKLEAMGRFDYTIDDCRNFHKAVKEVIVPLVKKIQEEKLQQLGKDKFKPWDLDFDPEGKAPLKPFKTGTELVNGTIAMFDRIDPYFADCIKTMKSMQHLDLESKDGKAPGGYNYPLYEIGVPFIFMNAVGAQRDLVTMVHEGGHAIHSFLSRDLTLTGFKNLPSEVAELASMSMELLSMEEWKEFYTSADDFKRAKREQLEGIIKIMPWIAQVDEFQHWLYENPDHTAEERTAFWMQLNHVYGTGLTDWEGFEDVRETTWQRQLHIFEVPFYYIEYGIAQLGALGVWMNSRDNKTKAVADYKAALRLAYTRSIPEIYATAGVPFDFSANRIGKLATFLLDEIEKLK